MRGRPPSIREEEILDAARDVFREEGHATTTAKIAKRAGFSEGILFYRYRSKEALLAAVIFRETQPPEALRELAKLVGKRSVAANLREVVGALLDAVVRAHPFLELAQTSPTSGEIHQLLFSRAEKPPPQLIVELLAGYLEAEVRVGRVRHVDTTVAARAVFGGCIDYVRSGQAEGDPANRRAFVRGLVDILVRGVVTTAPSSRRR